MAESAIALQECQKAVDSLYEFRDHYVERFGLEKAAHKGEEVKAKMEETLQILDKHKDNITNKATSNFLRGKTLNVLPGYDPQAHEALSKSVKLDPSLVEAWNHLGESYWKNGDIPGAKNCFTGALSHSKNKVSLRNLSMVLRQLSGPPTELVNLTEESVEKAKEAVQLDITDGMSWIILGNAYLKLFFAAGQNPKTLKQCLSAYSQAEKDPVALGNPDLFFNRGTCYKYQEEYQQALNGFARAHQLDPTWSEPAQQEQEIMDYLTHLTDLLQTKGKMKGKKLESLVQSLSQKDLGPYGGGSYTGPRGKTVTLKHVKLKELKPELNAETVVCGKVVCTVAAEDAVPFTFCIVDEIDCCVPVTVYNIAPGCGVKIGDTVAIPEPYIQTVNVDHKKKTFFFQSIRVNTPVVMVVNGKKLGLDKQAPSVLSVSTLSE